jgi:hypothetical protein
MKKINRQNAKKPRQGKFWCLGCDRCLVYEWSKCKLCGTRNNLKRLKKYPPCTSEI